MLIPAIYIYNTCYLSVACETTGHKEHTQEACTTTKIQWDNVIIGGSISEGHPGLHGFSHGQCDNKPGQLSYSIEQRYGDTLNMGIGGQSCREILNRFSTSVLIFKPKRVFMNCGHNKLSNDVLSVYDEVIRLAEENNFELHILNISKDYRKPGNTSYIKELNREISNFASENVKIYDTFTWSENNEHLLPDGLHPSKEGYEKLANETINL